MDYVICSKNTYVKLNQNGTPDTCTKMQAQKFEYSKAQNILGTLPKTMKKFHFKVQAVPEIVPKCEATTITKVVAQENYTLPENIQQWVDKVKNLNGLAKEASERKKALCAAHAEVERRKLNVEHEIELAERVNACDGYKKFRELKTVLEDRRKIKDELLVLGVILGSDLNRIAADHVEKSIEGLKHRTYEYR